MKISIKGADLESVLRHSKDLPKRSGGKLQTYGIQYKISGNDLSITQVGKKNFSPEQYYSTALSDFLYAGGDGYTEFAARAKAVSPDGFPLNQIFSDFIREKKEITKDLVESLKHPPKGKN